MAHASVSVEVDNNKDTDGDGVMDVNDRCPGVRGDPQHHGCPPINTHDYTCLLSSALGSERNCTSG